ncbi:MAG: hypothetical protein HY22_01245 [[Candidatus Thermochlorobacteriaceae] bacterium GBChlB]|nr:MAG: hypothetical protein HY22_01245 [[Candidatus Thermochlorobacteriaceae] bacterium GBChlB]
MNAPLNPNTSARLLPLLFFIAVSSCRLEQPVTPVWDIDAALPLVDASYTAESLLDKLDTTATTVTPNGTVAYFYDTTFQNSFRIGDSLTISISDTARTKAVNRLKIPRFQAQAVQTLGQIASASGIALPQGNSVSLPTFSNIVSTTFSFALDENIRSVTVTGGGIRLVATNNTGIRFENLRIELRDVTRNAVLGSITIASLAPGATLRDSVLFSGVFTNRLAAQIVDGQLPAQTGVSVNLNNQLRLQIEPTDVLTYTAAEVRFDAQTFVETGTVRAVGGNLERLRSATIKQGSLSLRFVNPIALNGSAQVRLAGLTQGSTVFQAQSQLPALQSTTIVSPSLAGWTFRPVGDTATEYETTVSVNSARDFIRVDLSTEFLIIYTTTNRFAASRAEGVVWNTSQNRPLSLDFSLDSLTTNFSRVDTLNGQLFPEIEFSFRNGVGFTIRANPRFSAQNSRTRQSIDLLRNNALISIDLAPNAVTPLRLDATNSNVSQFVTSLPTTITTRGTAALNPNRVFGTVTDTSTVSVGLRFLIPFQFNLNAFGVRDTAPFNNPPDLQDAQSVALNLRIENGIPLNTTFRLTFLDANRRVLFVDAAQRQAFTLPRNNFPASISPAPVTATGESNGTTRSEITLELNKTEIDLLRQARAIIVNIAADTRQQGTARLSRVRQRDTFRVRAVARIGYRLGQ